MLQFCNIYKTVSKYSNFLSYGFMISKLMILSSLHVYELIFTTSSLSSFCKPKSTLETAVNNIIQIRYFLKLRTKIFRLKDQNQCQDYD